MNDQFDLLILLIWLFETMAKVFHIYLIQVKYTYLIPYRFESPKMK